MSQVIVCLEDALSSRVAATSAEAAASLDDTDLHGLRFGRSIGRSWTWFQRPSRSAVAHAACRFDRTSASHAMRRPSDCVWCSLRLIQGISGTPHWQLLGHLTRIAVVPFGVFFSGSQIAQSGIPENRWHDQEPDQEHAVSRAAMARVGSRACLAVLKGRQLIDNEKWAEPGCHFRFGRSRNRWGSCRARCASCKKRGPVGPQGVRCCGC